MVANPLDLLIPTEAAAPPAFVWGYVTGTGQVTLDGDAAPLAATPDSLVPLTTLGARVLVLRDARRVVVLGIAQ